MHAVILLIGAKTSLGMRVDIEALFARERLWQDGRLLDGVDPEMLNAAPDLFKIDGDKIAPGAKQQPVRREYWSMPQPGCAARNATKRSCFGGGAANARSKRLRRHVNPAHSPPMTEDLETTILTFLKRAPEWIRRDLTAKDHGARTQAEEAFAAMLADALRRAET